MQPPALRISSLDTAYRRLRGAPPRTAHPAHFQRCPSVARLARAALVIAGALCTLAGCQRSAVAPSPENPGSIPEPGPVAVLHIHAEAAPPGGRLALGLSLRIPAELLPTGEAPIEFAFPTRRAGRSGFLEDIRDIQARDAEETALPITAAGPGRILVRHRGAGDVVLSWRLAPSHTHYTDSARFRAIASTERLLAPGHAFLAQPLNLREHEPAVRVSFTTDPGVPAALTSLPGANTSSDLGNLLNAMFLAGTWERLELPCIGQSLRIVAQDRPPKSVGRFVCDVLASQRLLHTHAATLVIIAPRQDPLNPRTGSAFDGGFILELPPGEVLLDDTLAMLVAHEQMHRLIGHRISFSPADATATNWFLEGVTDYLSLRTLVAAELLAPRQFLDRLAEAMDSLAGRNPRDPQARHDPPQGPGDFFLAEREPYDRGLLIGLLLDLALQPHDAPGARLRGLNAAVAAMGDAPATTRTALTAASLRTLLSQGIAPTLEEHWSDLVRLDAMPAVHGALQRIGLQVVERLEPAPFFGLRAASTAEGQWYIAEVVPNSPADLAGLTAGQALASRPVMRPDRRGRDTLAVSLPTAGGQRAIVLSAQEGRRLRHHLEISDPATFRSFVQTGRGSASR